MSHNQAILDMSAKAAFTLLELQIQTTIAQRQRIAELEERLEQARGKIEAAETQEYERAKDMLEHQNKLELQERGMRALELHLPTLLSFISAKFNPQDRTAQTNALLALFQSLSPEQIQAIAESGVLNQDQLTAVLAIRDSLARAEANSAGVANSGDTERVGA